MRSNQNFERKFLRAPPALGIPREETSLSFANFDSFSSPIRFSFPNPIYLLPQFLRDRAITGISIERDCKTDMASPRVRASGGERRNPKPALEQF